MIKQDKRKINMKISDTSPILDPFAWRQTQRKNKGHMGLIQTRNWLSDAK
jgi:hypothetical protein